MPARDDSQPIDQVFWLLATADFLRKEEAEYASPEHTASVPNPAERIYTDILHTFKERLGVGTPSALHEFLKNNTSPEVLDKV